MKKITTVLTGVVALGLLAVSGSQAVSRGTVVPNDTHQFLARVTSSAGGCSGALVDPEWIVTSSSCLPESGETQVVVGDVNLGTGTGHRTTVTKVVRHTGRDLAVARLAAAAPVVPVELATTAAAQGEALQAAGFGRTADEWVPDRPRLAAFTATSSTATTTVLDGAADLCRGDAGGPLFREVNGVAHLVGIGKTSWQNGRLLVTETRKGSTATRTDDVVTWIRQQYAGQRLRNSNQLCADLGSNAPGTVVGMTNCRPGHWISQNWQVPGDGTIRNYNGLCLDLGSNAPGTELVIAACRPAPGWTSQQWTFNTGTIRNHNGLCLDLGSNAPGTPIVIANCGPAPGWTSQQWTMPNRI